MWGEFPPFFKGLLRRVAPRKTRSTANPVPSNSEPLYRPHDAHDVYHVAFILQQVLVADLIPHILDLAEYWTKTSQQRREDEKYDQATCGEPYLTAAVAKGSPMVRRVEFSITSHDQGWSNYPEYHGSGQATWTWFEAEIYAPDIGRPSAAARELCRNVHADGRYKTHVISWRWDAEDEQERDIIRSLGPDKLISVVPWARYPGWRNHVSGASIDIYTAVIRRL